MSVIVRPMREGDLPEVARIVRLAFGTQFGLPDPERPRTDADMVGFRFRAAPDWAFVAERDGEPIGSCFAARWGTFGFFGPLTVHPEAWGGGVARRLLEPVMGLFDAWELRQAALFTIAESPKHVALYRGYGFLPGQLTAITERVVDAAPAEPPPTFARAADAAAALEACRGVAGAQLPGLDLTHEILAADRLGAGDTVLLDGAFAVCHVGAGEAGSGEVFVKFAAARDGERFDALLDACAALAASRGIAKVVAGVNLARRDAWSRMLARGHRAVRHGVVMQRPDAPGTCHPGAYVVDDLR